MNVDVKENVSSFINHGELSENFIGKILSKENYHKEMSTGLLHLLTIITKEVDRVSDGQSPRYERKELMQLAFKVFADVNDKI